jgi:hypothetical protein
VPEKHTFGIQKLCLMERTEPYAYDLPKVRKIAYSVVGTLQRSHANALPDLPSLASMVTVEL